MFEHRSASRFPKAQIEGVIDRGVELLDLTRTLLLEHLRDHVKKTGSLECHVCTDAPRKLSSTWSSIGALIWP